MKISEIINKKTLFKGLYTSALVILFTFSFSTFITALSQYDELSEIGEKNPSDFVMYLTGANIASDGRIGDLYDAELQNEVQDKIVYLDGLLAFRTPPIVAVMYSPLANLDYTNAFIIVVAVNLLIFIAIIYALVNNEKIPRNTWIFIVSLTLLFVPLWATILYGHITLLILLFITVSYIFIKEEKFFIAGLLLSGTFLKPQFLLIVPLVVAVYAYNSNIKYMIKGFLLGLFVLIVLNVAIYGPEFLTVYPRFVLSTESLGFGTNLNNNANISSLLVNIIENEKIVNTLTVVINAFLYLATIAFLLKKKATERNTVLDFSAVVILSPLLSLHTMQTDLVVYILPLFLLANYFYDKVSKFRLFLAIALFLAIPRFDYLELQYLTALSYFLIGMYFLLNPRRLR